MASPRVRLTSQLDSQLQLAGNDPNDLIADFQDWKTGAPDNSYTFGEDLLGIGSSYLYHAHMVPVTVAADLTRWSKAWSQRKKRTSDRYLFYANGGMREGYLLIALIDDPGAHAIWQNQTALQDLEQVADDFCVYGLVP